MTTSSDEFLSILLRVIKLHKDLRYYSTNYHKFTYDLDEINGVLTLVIHYPHMGSTETVTYSSTRCKHVAFKLDEAECYLRERQESG